MSDSLSPFIEIDGAAACRIRWHRPQPRPDACWACSVLAHRIDAELDRLIATPPEHECSQSRPTNQPKDTTTMNHDLTDRHQRKWSAVLGETILSQQTMHFTDDQGVRRIWQTTRTANGLLRRETIDRDWVPVGAAR